MSESTKSAKPTQQAPPSIARTPEDLRAVGMTPREIYRLRVLRDCIGYYPHLEFFNNDEWRRLLFMKWRYDHGEYGQGKRSETIIIDMDLNHE